MGRVAITESFMQILRKAAGVGSVGHSPVEEQDEGPPPMERMGRPMA